MEGEAVGPEKGGRGGNDEDHEEDDDADLLCVCKEAIDRKSQ